MANTKITLEKSIEINSINYLHQCSKCKETKPNSEYSPSLNKRVSNSLGRAFVSECKSCRRLYNNSRKVLDRKKELAPIQRNKHRLSSIFWASKQNAKKRNLDHNIDLEYIKELFNTQQSLCYYTNKEMFIDTRTKKNNEDSVSLDRVDSSKGYIKGNVVLCRWVVNRIKNDLSTNKFFEIIKEIYKFNNL
jgi:predicted HicB family RNase H-like nuclease